MVTINPNQIKGRWRKGFALDIQTVSSTFLGYNESGHEQFDTKRSEIGQLLYRLKYRSDEKVVPDLVATAVGFLKEWNPQVDGILLVPPSKIRKVQPVPLLARGIANSLDLEFMDGVIKKTRDIPQLKDVQDGEKRAELLKGIFSVDKAKTKGRRLLLFDDLFRSGATMNEITETLYDQGQVADVFALTITSTRSKS